MAGSTRVANVGRGMAVGLLLAAPWALAQPVTLPSALAAARDRPDPFEARLDLTRDVCGAATADAEYAAANERMAMDYVVFDRARARAGERWVHDAAIKAQEAVYAKAFEWRLAARQRQRLHRLALSLHAGTPVPDEVDAPAPPDLKSLPDPVALASRLAATAAWRASEALPPPRRDAARHELRVALERLALAVETLAKGTLPRLAREEEAANLRLERAREDTANGQRGDLGNAMAATSEAAWRRLAAECEAHVALAELERLVRSPAAEWSAPK